MKVFVYGTLKKGKGLHYLMEGSKFIADGTLEGYEMFSLISFPFIRKGKGTIYGEIYEIDDKTLGMLDTVENGYERIKVNIKTNEKLIECFVYVMEDLPMISLKVEGGVWK